MTLFTQKAPLFFGFVNDEALGMELSSIHEIGDADIPGCLLTSTGEVLRPHLPAARHLWHTLICLDGHHGTQYEFVWPFL
jgi:hypothetical protein